MNLLKVFFGFAMLLFIPFFLAGQDGGGAYEITQEACLSKQQKVGIINKLKENAILYKSVFEKYIKENKSLLDEKFIWPVEQTHLNSDPSYYGISNYLDHNSTIADDNGSLRDYNCGQRTYDVTNYNHSGTDIFTWPFPWLKMDNDEVKAVAAKDGIIIDINNGNYDRNCSFCSNCSWNAVYLLHADGLVTWYGHLKDESIPPFQIGDTVEKGDKLGIIGSSGISTGPHLHFEVWDSQNYNYNIDPFIGNCNSISNSLWERQQAYRNSRINLITTGYGAPVDNQCDEPWETNISEHFDIGDQIFFSIYLADEIRSNVIGLQVLDENETVIESWGHTANTTYDASYWFWNRLIDSKYTDGKYIFRARYEGEVVDQPFYIGESTSLKSDFIDVGKYVHYNAHDKKIHLDDSLNFEYERVLITSIDGKVLFSGELNKNIKSIPIHYNGIINITLWSKAKASASALIPILN